MASQGSGIFVTDILCTDGQAHTFKVSCGTLPSSQTRTTIRPLEWHTLSKNRPERKESLRSIKRITISVCSQRSGPWGNKEIRDELGIRPPPSFNKGGLVRGVVCTTGPTYEKRRSTMCDLRVKSKAQKRVSTYEIE